MASVDFKKCKAGTGDAGALLRHCDAQERLKHEHGNEHIDKSLTPGNRQGARNYRQTMAALRDRLAELDAVPGANRRKDRVECFFLEIPVPAGHDPQRFAEMAVREITDMYGERNVLNWYMHVDEVHTYLDHGEERTSLCHIHVPVVPEIGGRLCGKEFSSRTHMMELNRRIDEGARELGGPAFLTGEHPRKRSVEELKISSYREASEAAERAEQGKAYLQRLQGEIEPLERVLGRLRGDTPIAKRRVYKSLGGEYIRISPEEARAIDAAVAVQTPLVEAEERARAVVRDAQRSADKIIDHAHSEAAKTMLDATFARIELDKIQRDHPELFNNRGSYIDPQRQHHKGRDSRDDRHTPGGRG